MSYGMPLLQHNIRSNFLIILVLFLHFFAARPMLLRLYKPLFQLKNKTLVKASTTLATMSTAQPLISVDQFCYRQFSEHEASKTYSGTIINMAVSDFTKIVNDRYCSNPAALKDGYAPFCKHLFVPNFTDARVNVLPITKENEHLLRTKYEARNEKELPVLTRYFPKELLAEQSTLPVAKYLDLILYSREQIKKENAAMGKDSRDSDEPWGIVSIKAQDVDYELPMQPITVMRNALGVEEGGSGKPLKREEYMEAYNYWNRHAILS